MRSPIDRLKPENNTAIPLLLATHRKFFSGLLTTAYYCAAILLLGVPPWKTAAVAAFVLLCALNEPYRAELRKGGLVLVGVALGAWTGLIPR